MRIATTSISLKPTTILAILQILLVILLPACSTPDPTQEPDQFDAQRAFEDLEFQVGLGPRTVGSMAHEQFRNWLVPLLLKQGWEVEVQSLEFLDQDVHNIIAKHEVGDEYPWIILGAHYDSRMVADKDPIYENRSTPVPGANDGASGVAVLNEIARVLPDGVQANIWLVYFDAEDNGNLPGGEWILGSRAFVEELVEKPDAVVILDMVADKDLKIFVEKNSDYGLVQEIWETAHSLGYQEFFINQPKHGLIDDHTPFIQAGIRAVNIIDFDYPHWHTLSDTVDKVSAESLGIVGDVVLKWLLSKYMQP
jgi:hypothetical protein